MKSSECKWRAVHEAPSALSVTKISSRLLWFWLSVLCGSNLQLSYWWLRWACECLAREPHHARCKFRHWNTYIVIESSDFTPRFSWISSVFGRMACDDVVFLNIASQCFHPIEVILLSLHSRLELVYIHYIAVNLLLESALKSNQNFIFSVLFFWKMKCFLKIRVGKLAQEYRVWWPSENLFPCCTKLQRP